MREEEALLAEIASAESALATRVDSDAAKLRERLVHFAYLQPEAIDEILTDEARCAQRISAQL